MSRVNTIDKLPPEVRTMIQQALYYSGFSDYTALAAKLKALGYAISRSALHRYGQQFRERMRKAEAEKTLGG